MNKQEAIIIALCRCALAGTPTEATKHQIVRLKKSYLDNDSYEMVAAIDKLMNPEPNELDGFKVVQSEAEMDSQRDALVARFKKHCSIKEFAVLNTWKAQTQFQSNVFEIDDMFGRIRIYGGEDNSKIESWDFSTKSNSGEDTHRGYKIPNETYFELAKLYKGE